MTHIIFSIFDIKAHAYLSPFILPEADMAKRVFTDCVNDREHAFGKHPHDYTLFQLGAWNDHDAKYSLENSPVTLGNGLEFLEKDEDKRQATLGLVDLNKVGENK